MELMSREDWVRITIQLCNANAARLGYQPLGNDANIILMNISDVAFLISSRIVQTLDQTPMQRDAYIHGINKYVLQELKKNAIPIRSGNSTQEKELDAIRKYLRYLSREWWNNQPASRTTATCDACSAEAINRNDGYLVGSNLWCDTCYMTKAVAWIKQDGADKMLGHEVLSKALKMFGNN